MTVAANREARIRRARERIARLRARLLALDLVCAGTLSRRFMRCGKSSCRCSWDPDARHGPYFEWTRHDRGRFTNIRLSPAVAARYAQAIANVRTARRILVLWERESRRIMDILD